MKQNAAAEAARVAAAAPAAAAPAAAATTKSEPSAADERARVTGILALPEAKGRDALASQLIANGMSVEGAKATLASVPLATTTPAPDQRNGGGAEMGNGDGQAKPTAEVIAKGWSKAFSRF